MGGCGSKDKTKEKKDGADIANKSNASSDLPDPQAAPGRATNANDANMENTDAAAKSEAKTDAASSAAPKTRKGDEVDDDGNPVVLPKGDWVHTENTPYYYSATENLYYHPPSCQFYDPTNEMWYDPEKDEWYRDETDGEGANEDN